MLEVDEEKITPKARIAEDLGADSLDSVDITIKLEEVFNIEILDEDVEKMKTVDDILTYLAHNKEG
ncbi:MAG: acyl carrier protein [Candidatus Omnitrophica bacterium]|nr:acyl carrier protein [Candidatus Omnitrophota bacterium]